MNRKKNVSVDRCIDKISRFSAPNQIKEYFLEKRKPALEKLNKESFNQRYSVAAWNTVSNNVNVPFLGQPHFSYKESLVNFEVKSDVKRPASTLNSSASAFQYSSDFLNITLNIYSSAGGVFEPCLQEPD